MVFRLDFQSNNCSWWWKWKRNSLEEVSVCCLKLSVLQHPRSWQSPCMESHQSWRSQIAELHRPRHHSEETGVKTIKCRRRDGPSLNKFHSEALQEKPIEKELVHLSRLFGRFQRKNVCSIQSLSEVIFTVNTKIKTSNLHPVLVTSKWCICNEQVPQRQVSVNDLVGLQISHSTGCMLRPVKSKSAPQRKRGDSLHCKKIDHRELKFVPQDYIVKWSLC